MSNKHPSTTPSGNAPEGDRIAKVLARAGVASRREAERMIEIGRVAVNGKVLDSPALNVTPKDRITVDGKPIAEPEPERLWLYNKPIGLVTSHADEKGRETIFDRLPEDMPRVMSVGRLDLNSEGLLLLTNDGGVKRKLELPATGWLRKYRVRVNGRPDETTFGPLRKGITVEGEKFQPMTVSLDRQQGANAWLTVAIREGRNREIRRAMEAVGLTVNRLIRVSYGPFQLGQLKPGEVEEVRRRVLRDQLGLEGAIPQEDRPEPKRPTRPASKAAPKTGDRPTGGPTGRPTGRPTGKPVGKPTGKLMGKSFGKAGGKAGGKSDGKSGGGRFADKSLGRPTGKPTGKPAGKSGGKSGGKAWSKPAGGSGGKIGGKSGPRR